MPECACLRLQPLRWLLVTSMFFLSYQVVNFTEEFYSMPVIIVTANHEYDSKDSYSVKPENNIINSWVEV